MDHSALLKITRENYVDRLGELIDTDKSIPLKELTVPKLNHYIEYTVNLYKLGVCLQQEGLLQCPELQKLKAKETSYEQNEFLYNELLNKRVQQRKHYECLFKALFQSGNDIIAEHLFDALTMRTRRFNSSTSFTPQSTVSNVTINNVESRMKQNTKCSQTVMASVVMVTIVFGLVGLPLVIYILLQGDQLATTSAPNPTSISSIHHPHPSKFVPEYTHEEKPEKSTIDHQSLTRRSTVEPSMAKGQEDQLLKKSASAPKGSSELPVPITIPSKHTMSINIGSPTDLYDLPEGGEIRLAINTTKDSNWEAWFPQNADKVLYLRLTGMFTTRAIRHFLSIMNNLTILVIDSLGGKLCGEYFRATLLLHKNLQDLRLTHLEDMQCKSVYQFLTKYFDFPKLNRVQIVNLPMMQENEEYVVEFFNQYHSQLTNIDFRGVTVYLGSQAFAQSKFPSVVSLHSEFSDPSSKEAKFVFANLNRATPNLVDVSSNLVCTEDERYEYAMKWPKINGRRRMICDLHKGLK